MTRAGALALALATLACAAPAPVAPAADDSFEGVFTAAAERRERERGQDALSAPPPPAPESVELIFSGTVGYPETPPTPEETGIDPARWQQLFGWIWSGAVPLRKTDRISAALGVRFGFFFVAKAAERMDTVRVQRVIRFPEPGLRATAISEPTLEAVSEVDCVADLVCEALYHLTESYQLVPGEWTIEIVASGKTLLSETYQVEPSLEPPIALPSAPPLEAVRQLDTASMPDVHPFTDTCNPELAARARRFTQLTFDEVLALARARDPVAQNEAGRRYGLGTEGPRDPEAAFAWYRDAAAQRLCQAEANLAFMYFSGEGVERSLAQALHWNLSAAMQGHSEAQYALGYLYITGTGVPRNGPLAERWFLLAANQGSIAAQEALMRMYEAGDGVARDPAKAIYWLHRME